MAKAKKTTNKKIKVTQVGSAIGKESSQRKTLIGLGLNKMHKSKILQDTDAVRGMINKVQHLVVVDEVK